MVTHLLVLSEEIDPLVIVVLKYVAFGQFELDNIKQKRVENHSLFYYLLFQELHIAAVPFLFIMRIDW